LGLKKGGKMTAIEVIKLACEYLGDYDLLKVTTLGGTNTPTDMQTEKITTLKTCLNDVVQSLALMYMPLKFIETLSSTTKEYNFVDFGKTVLEILKVKDLKNNPLCFKCFPEYMTTTETKIIVEYCYQPNFVSSLSSELDVAKERVSIRLVALGVTARYFLYQGLYQESTAWDNMFERAILVANAKTGEARLKKRGWY